MIMCAVSVMIARNRRRHAAFLAPLSAQVCRAVDFESVVASMLPHALAQSDCFPWLDIVKCVFQCVAARAAA